MSKEDPLWMPKTTKTLVEERLERLEAIVRELATESYTDNSEECLKVHGKAEVWARCLLCQAENYGDINHTTACLLR